jgi:predicted ester cyclase
VLRSEAELWSKGNLAVADELYSPDFVCHFIVGPEWRGVEGIKREVRRHRASFPDWNERVDDIVAEGDRVVIRFTSTGTQRGEFAGIAPTGRKVSIQEVAIYRVVRGEIVEQ